MSRLISTDELHNVVMRKSNEYGKLAVEVDNIVEEMVKETPTVQAIRLDKIKKAREKIASSLNGLCEDDYAEKVAKFYIERDLRILDSLIESEG